MKHLILAALALLASLAAVPPLLAQTYNIPWHKIAAGGGTSVGAVYTLRGTAGQWDAGKLGYGNLTVDGGYWPEASAIVGTVPPPLYAVVNLGTLGGPFQNESEAYGINNSGAIVGYSYLAPNQPRAVYWADTNSPAANLGVAGGYDQSFAWKINDSGAVVGWSTLRTNGQTHATYWPGGGDLGTFGGGSPGRPLNSAAYSVNSSGKIVGYAQQGNEAGPLTYAAYWGSGSSAPSLLSFPNGKTAYAINDSGEIVGIGPSGAAVLSPSGSELDLMSPSDSLVGGSIADGINGSGQIIGYYLSTNFSYHAIYWLNAYSAPVQLAGLPGSTVDLPESINASGQIVGGSGGNSIGGIVGGLPGGHAVLWQNSACAPIDLNTLISANAGLVLNMAYGINDSGVIVGRGLIDGVPFAFALVPTAPASTLRITSVSRVGNGLQLSFTSEPCRTYDVLTTSDLRSGTWSTLLTGIAGNGGIVQTTVSNAFLAPQQFFRIQQAP